MVGGYWEEYGGPLLGGIWWAVIRRNMVRHY